MFPIRCLTRSLKRDVSVESFSAQNYLIATQWCFFFFFFFWKNILSPLATCLRKWSSSYLKMTTMKHHRKKFNSYPVADQENASYAVYKNKPHFRDGSFKKSTYRRVQSFKETASLLNLTIWGISLNTQMFCIDRTFFPYNQCIQMYFASGPFVVCKF